MSSPTADVSVRVAWADDAHAIAAVQLRAWQEKYADLLPAGVLPDDVESVAEAWRTSLTRPEDARNRVLVALERNRVKEALEELPPTHEGYRALRDARARYAEIVEAGGIECEVTPASTDEMARPAPRPAYSVLRSERPGAPVLPDWREGLHEFIASLVSTP